MEEKIFYKVKENIKNFTLTEQILIYRNQINNNKIFYKEYTEFFGSMISCFYTRHIHIYEKFFINLEFPIEKIFDESEFNNLIKEEILNLEKLIDKLLK